MELIGAHSLYWVVWLLTAACGAIFILKFKGSRSAVLGGIGFGVFVAIPIFVQIFLMFGISWWEYSFGFDLLRIGGWVLLIIALIKLPGHTETKPTGVNTASFHSQSRTAPIAPQPAYQPAPMIGQKYISKGLFIGSILGGAGASMLFGLIAFALLEDYEEELAIPFLLFAFLAVIYVAVMISILVYRLWIAIQPGHPRTTPGKAVGFLFIPLFNLYWVFQAYFGWAQDYNRYVQGAGIQSPPVSENMALTVSILVVASSIPYVGILPAMVNLIFLGIFFSQAIDGANRLIEAQSAPAQAD